MRGKHHIPRRWWPWWRKREPPAPRRHLSCIVDGSDGQEHLITDEAYAQGMEEGTGHYQVLCGSVIAVASMVTPPGRRCLSCHTLEAIT